MSNETDLDWLARNVHEWLEGANYVCVNHTDGGHVFHEHNRNCAIWFTKDQWISRRAELQNKPSWDDFGESAKFMAQDSDGAWMAFESEPAANYHVWSSMRGWCGYAREGRDRCRGEVLGDWRDTLERRSADLSEPAVTERLTEAAHTVLAAAPALMDEKFRFDRDDWHERGELPPVGATVMHMGTATDKDWLEVEIIAHAQRKGFKVAVFEYSGGVSFSSATYFRPIRTERDVLIEIIKKTDDTDDRIADAILAAGFKRGAA